MMRIWICIALFIVGSTALAQSTQQKRDEGYFTLEFGAGYGRSSSWNDIDEARILQRAGIYTFRRRQPEGYSFGGTIRRHHRSGHFSYGITYYRYGLPIKLTGDYPLLGTNAALLSFDEFAQRDAGNALLLALTIRIFKHKRFSLSTEITGGPVWLAVDDISTSALGNSTVVLTTLRTSNANFNELHTQGALNAVYALNSYYSILAGLRHNWEASTRSHHLTEAFLGVRLNLVEGGLLPTSD